MMHRGTPRPRSEATSHAPQPGRQRTARAAAIDRVPSQLQLQNRYDGHSLLHHHHLVCCHSLRICSWALGGRRRCSRGRRQLLKCTLGIRVRGSKPNTGTKANCRRPRRATACQSMNRHKGKKPSQKNTRTTRVSHGQQEPAQAAEKEPARKRTKGPRKRGATTGSTKKNPSTRYGPGCRPK